MAEWKFSCETKDSIPLPPEYTFPQAFNYLNSESNSFYILEAPNGDYMQCAGSKERCTVERRLYQGDKYEHHVFGKREGTDHPTKILMSNGEVDVKEREVFRHWEAIDFFKRFFSGEEFSDEIVFRKVDM